MKEKGKKSQAPEAKNLDDALEKEVFDQVKSENLEDELIEVRESLKQKSEEVLRIYAEMDNMRKRMEKEMGELLRYACIPLLRDLLEVVDNFERANEAITPDHLRDASDSVRQMIEGLPMVLKQLQGTIEKYDVVAVVPKMGESMDPTTMESFGEEKSEKHERGRVLKVVRKGYTLHGRLIRPALVIVAA